MKNEFKAGIDLIKQFKNKRKDLGRCALLSNHASLSHNGVLASKVAKSVLKEALTVLLSPQHGYWGTEQDNMLETDDSISKSGLPIYSLYSSVRSPTKKMLQNIDTIIIDLQLVGCRVYTFEATIYNCLKSAFDFNKKVIVLDRPNPLGGEYVEGPVVESNLKSFVAPYEIPIRHGLTTAEIALLFNKDFGAELEVVVMENWDPKSLGQKYFSPWNYTSPNLPTLDSVLVYYAMVLLEGTNISEGRGTSLPFQLMGAPYLSSSVDLIERVNSYYPDYMGVDFREIRFKPTSGKWMNHVCYGLNVRVLPFSQVRILQLAVALVRAFFAYGEGSFDWKSPPYEYEFETSPIKLLLGQNDAEVSILEEPLNSTYWCRGIKEYVSEARKVLLYDRELKYSV